MVPCKSRDNIREILRFTMRIKKSVKDNKTLKLMPIVKFKDFSPELHRELNQKFGNNMIIKFNTL